MSAVCVEFATDDREGNAIRGIQEIEEQLRYYWKIKTTEKLDRLKRDLQTIAWILGQEDASKKALAYLDVKQRAREAGIFYENIDAARHLKWPVEEILALDIDRT